MYTIDFGCLIIFMDESRVNLLQWKIKYRVLEKVECRVETNCKSYY